MPEPVFEITKAAQFDAAHSLPHGPKAEYRRLHGHSFRVEATLRGVMDAGQGWVADLGALDAALKALAGELDHGHLNETPGLETPTLERLCLHFAERLRPQFAGLARVSVSRPTVDERCVLDVKG
jgi:6-pyruvoyltetrahydropterin/6-carboxytetrahydropterin synthase